MIRQESPLANLMKTFRRFLVLVALGYWQGGFTFYSAIVVRVGEEVLGSAREQGFVTRRITNYLNAAGVVALVLCACDISFGTRSTIRHRSRWTCGSRWPSAWPSRFGCTSKSMDYCNPMAC